MEAAVPKIPDFVLNSGHKMPAVGLGTGAASKPPADELIRLFVDAIAAGYRHFDTAAFYRTEESLGRAVVEAVDRGLIGSRDELFITSKLWCTDTQRHLVLPALNESLRKLGLEYVDLYLIHWPVTMKKDGDTSQMLTFDIEQTWKAMEECSRLGLAKSIGVSNFTCAKLSKLLQNATISPAVNQVEMNVGWQQQKLLHFCKENDIQVCAWSPLGAYGDSWGTHTVMDSTVLKEIAEAKNKTVAQVALRWIHEQEVAVIVRSFNRDRMKQNLQFFDWELTGEEVRKIQKIPQKRSSTAEQEFVRPDGQYKTLEELWDGEI